MAMGQLSSLGLGSGVLNYDVIEKLKKADERAMVAPIDKKMQENIEKQKELMELNTLISGVKSPVSSLSDYSTYIGRTSDVSNDAIKATVSPGVPIQDIKIDVEEVAKNDINEVGIKFSSRDDVFSNKDVKLNFFTKGKRYSLDIQAGMTLNDVAQAITDKSDGEVMGIVMKTGGEKPYQLMINSKGTGEANRIFFGSTLASERIKELPELGEGDFTITLKDKYLNNFTVNVTLDAKEAATQDRMQTLVKAIRKAIEENPDTKELLDKDFNVSLSEDNTSLVLNDRRGYAILLGGNKLSTLGFSTTETKQEVLFNSKTPIASGKIDGSITIGTVPLDLSKMTKDGNTSEENAKIIADAIENIAGIHAKTDGKGHLSINSEIGEVKIVSNNSGGEKFLKDIGIKGGLLQNYTRLEEEIFDFKNLQQASDAKILFNGAIITRPTNEINDIINGVNLTLMHTTEPGNPAIISIRRDTEMIKTQVQDFVKAYNELVPKLDELTRYDPETKIAGVFNGVSDIRTIRSSLNMLISKPVGFSSTGRPYSLVDFGISLDEKSRMSLNGAKLDEMIRQDAEQTINSFYGYDKKNPFGQEEHTDGIFVQLNQFIKGLIDGSNAKLTLYQDSLTRDAKNLDKDKAQANERLKARYDTMASRFAAYDEQIAKANNAFTSVQMMIDQAANKKK